MKKNLVLPLLLVALTSCANIPQNSVTINGKTYKTGFSKYYGDDLHIVNLMQKDFSTSDYKSGKYHYWLLKDQQFDMCYGEHEESVIWDPTLYCVTTEIANAKKYYSDLSNYDYFIGTYLHEESFIKVDDKQYFNAIEYAIKIMVTTPFSRRVHKKINLEEYQSLTLFRTSKDNLLTTTRDEFLYNEETGFIYLASYFDNSGDAIYYTLNKENGEILDNLYKSVYQIKQS